MSMNQQRGDAYMVHVEPQVQQGNFLDVNTVENDFAAGPAMDNNQNNNDREDSLSSSQSEQSEQSYQSEDSITAASSTFSGTIETRSAINTNDYIQVSDTDKALSKKKALKYFNRITNNQVEIIQQSWKLVYDTNRQELIEQFQQSLTKDSLLPAKTRKFVEAQQTVSIIVDSHNRVIQFLSTEEDEDEVHDINNDDDDPAARSSFEYLYAFLYEIGKIHVLNHITTEDLLLARKHLLKTLKYILGAGFNNDTKQAFLDLTNFMCIMLLIAFRESQGTVKFPTRHSIAYAMETWPFIQKNAEAISIILWRELTDQFNEFSDYFPSPQSLKTIFAGIGELINLYKNKTELNDALVTLGANHIKYSIHSDYFKYFYVAWLRTLKKTLGTAYKKKVNASWKRILKYFIKMMSDSLDEEWMLMVPEEPKSLQFLMSIHHIDDIDPQNYSFRSEIDACISETKAPSKMLESRLSFEACKKNSLSSSNNDDKHGKRDWNAYIENVIHSEKDNNVKYQLQDGSCFQRLQIGGQFEKEFDMKNFPFDKHELMFYFKLGVPTTDAVFDRESFEVTTGKGKKLDRLGGSSWTVLDPCFQFISAQLDSKTGISGQVPTEEICVITVPIVRKWKNYVWQVFFPLWVIELTAFCVYFMESTPIFYRMQFQAVLMSTLLAFKFTIMSMLPKVSYLTNLDYHFNLAFSFIFLNVVFGGVVRVLLENSYLDSLPSENDYQSKSSQVDMGMLIGIIVCYAVAKSKMLHDTKQIIKGLQYYIEPETGIRKLRQPLTGDGNKQLKSQPTLYSANIKKIGEDIESLYTTDEEADKQANKPEA